MSQIRCAKDLNIDIHFVGIRYAYKNKGIGDKRTKEKLCFHCTIKSKLKWIIHECTSFGNNVMSRVDTWQIERFAITKYSRRLRKSILNHYTVLVIMFTYIDGVSYTKLLWQQTRQKLYKKYYQVERILNEFSIYFSFLRNSQVSS